MTPIRVLHAVDSMTGGGAQQVVLDLAAWADDNGVGVAILGGRGGRSADIAPGAEFIPVAGQSFLHYLVALARACRAFRPTVLHAHQRREALACLVVGRLLRIPVVEHAHTVLPSRRMRALSFRSRRIFSVGPSVTRMLHDGFGVPASKIDTVGNLVPSAAFAPPATTTPVVDRLRRDGERIILGVGRLEEQKDPERFVSIVAALGGGARGIWFGDGPLRTEMEQLIASENAPVVLAGRSATVVDEMTAADCLLLTSRWEGTPLVVLEAFARGLPVVAVGAPGVPELVGGRGELIDDAATPREAAEVVRRALSSRSDGPRRAAREYAENHADPDVVYAPVLAAYRALAGRRHRFGPIGPRRGGVAR